MKILKEGKLPEEEIFQGTCTHCKTVVEFSRKEAVVSNHRNETYLSVKCPLCKKEICTEV